MPDTRSFPEPQAGSSTVKFRSRSRNAPSEFFACPRCRVAAALDFAALARSRLLAIRALAVFHSASNGRTITGSMIRMILSRSV